MSETDFDNIISLDELRRAGFGRLSEPSLELVRRYAVETLAMVVGDRLMATGAPGLVDAVEASIAGDDDSYTRMLLERDLPSHGALVFETRNVVLQALHAAASRYTVETQRATEAGE